MQRAILLFLVTIYSFGARSQAPSQLSIGHRDSLFSKTLGEERHLLIYLPPNYSAAKRYPVAYLLDAESHFHMFTGIIRHVANDAIPELIVVGIVNVNRNRDYPPTHDPRTYDTANGHGEIFTAFLEKELIPYIDSHYAAAPYRLLAGHSLGGLMAVNTLLNHSTLFKAYLAVDPSLWWDRMKLVQQSGPLLAKMNRPQTSLFLGISGVVPQERNRVAQVMKDTSAKSRDVRSTMLFEESLRRHSGKELTWSSKIYPDEGHGTVPLQAYYDGLRFVFDFYKRPSMTTLTDSTVLMLERHYQRMSEKMGYTLLPPEYDLGGLAWRSAVLEKNLDRAYLYLQTYLRLYPKSSDAHRSVSDYYKAKGDSVLANHFREAALRLTMADK